MLPWKRNAEALLGLRVRISELESTQVPLGEQADLMALAGTLKGKVDELRAIQDGFAKAGDELERRTSALDTRLHEIRLAVAEGIERTDRAERRIKQTVKRAREKLKESGLEADDGLDAEDRGLRLIDGDGSSEMHPMPENVGEAQQHPRKLQGFPGTF
jgi:hypothetical protein